jgi:prepilin-type N-terminal cleavage/methylation domain-containing protein
MTPSCRQRRPAPGGGPLSGNERGFTLLELLISFAILGIIVVIIAGAMKVSIQAVSRGEKKLASIERLRTSLNVVEAQIQSESGLTYDDDGEKKRYFQGDRESMQLSTNYSLWGGERGYAVVSYEVTTDRDGKQSLKATETVIGMDNPRETTLFNLMDKIYFEYFYKGPTDEKGTWVDSWTDDTMIPEKVKLHLVANEKDFSIIIPLRTASSQNSTPPPAFPSSQSSQSNPVQEIFSNRGGK